MIQGRRSERRHSQKWVSISRRSLAIMGTGKRPKAKRKRKGQRRAFLSLALTLALAASAAAQTFPPKEYVPNASTAIVIARAVLIPIYGAERVKAEEPYKATRQGDVWTISGTLPCPKDEVVWVVPPRSSYRRTTVVS